MNRVLIEGITEAYTATGNGAVTRSDVMLRIEDAAILVEDDRIARIGTREELGRDLPADVARVDMGGKVAIPCFVDPHTHLVWGGDRSDEFNRRLHGAGYVEIAAAGGGIKSTVRQTRAADRDALAAKALRTLDTMLLHGVGTIEAKSGYGLDLETEIKQLDVMDQVSAAHPVEMVQTFMGAHEVPPEYAGRPGDYVDYLNRELLPIVAKRGNVPYVDIFCEKNVFELDDSRRHLEAAAAHGFKIRMHADELHPLGGAGLAAEMGAVSADHIVWASEEHMAAMAEAGTIATLLPGTSFFLRGRYADADAFKQAGCAVALSTDYNPGSSHTVSQALMMALACMNMGMTFEESFIGVTLNAAAAIDKAATHGTLEVGKKADIAFLDAPSVMYLVYYWGINHVSDVMKDGNFAVRDRRRIDGTSA
ncbi:imidazolonepropionase [Sulfidibacter corallicola]|uniref:Imidazolonepropionase n=1 Tax=Sulfidibacter corallicola TaxID=2818388 RepID=A0A8A4TV03_SULCO|nr:imidazolonepropionase [Sulfidibacter corallicola]QTD53313.1 imidazolonepropionase [Sulfidibacter corallicola]